MHEREKLAAAVLQAAEGEIIGRIRIQKIVYLLEQLGMEGGFRFSYHHYGPYSEELSDVLECAIEADRTIAEEQRPTEGGFYSVYTLAGPPDRPPATLGGLPWQCAVQRIRAMKAETSTVLELAATIHWLREKERVADWRKELKIRKASKADDGRVDRALDLLRRLELAA